MKKTIKILVWLIAVVMVMFLLDSVSGQWRQDLLMSTQAASVGWLLKRGLYAFVSLGISRTGMDFLTENFKEILLLNPDPRSQAIQDMTSSLMGIIMPFYLFAIALSAFYLLFVSGSPGGRAKAKTMIVHLVIGMMVVSISPLIITVFIELSETITRAIIDRSGTSIDVIPLAIHSIFGESEWEVSLTSLSVLHDFLTTVEIELGYFTMIPFILAIWGSLVIFFIRYAIIVLWIILFPLAVALYSFDTTRDIGRNMIEQAILWIVMQAFFATIAVATALCMMQKPKNYMSPALAIPGFDFVLFDFIPFMGIFTMLVAPLLLLRIFRSFLP